MHKPRVYLRWLYDEYKHRKYWISFDCLSVKCPLFAWKLYTISQNRKHTHKHTLALTLYWQCIALYIIYWSRNCNSCCIVIELKQQEQQQQNKAQIHVQKMSLALYHYLQAVLMKLLMFSYPMSKTEKPYYNLAKHKKR